MSLGESTIATSTSALSRALLLVVISLTGLAAPRARAQEGALLTGSDAVAGLAQRRAPVDSAMMSRPASPAMAVEETGKSESTASDPSAPAPERPSVSDTTAGLVEPERISQSEFMNGESPRYTMTGKLPYRVTQVSPTTISIFGGALAGLAAGIMWYQQVWYPDSTKGPFNFKTDIGYSKELDKFGHLYGGWMASYCSHEALIASGFSKDDAALWGSVGGLIWGTWVEVADGFHSNYGFDWTDEVSNLLGAASFYIQREVPFFQNFDYKWSIGPSGRDSARNAAQIRSRILIDDYDGQNVWLSARVHSLLPESLKSYWPKWLQLAVGYGAKDVELIGYTPYRTLYVALDYNLVELLPDMGPFMNWLVQGLNSFRFPAPALQILPDVRFKLLYPFDL